jgi:hypothetical protein
MDFKSLSLIPGYENFTNYEINSDAVIRNVRTGRILTYHKNGSGYLFVIIQHKKTVLKHRILASMHIPNPEGKEIVDHIDGDPLNNTIENLRWCSQSENCRNRATTSRNTSGVANISPITIKGYKFWKIEIKYLNADGIRKPIIETFKRDTEEIPEFIIERRHQLVKEHYGEFARELS